PDPVRVPVRPAVLRLGDHARLRQGLNPPTQNPEPRTQNPELSDVDQGGRSTDQSPWSTESPIRTFRHKTFVTSTGWGRRARETPKGRPSRTRVRRPDRCDRPVACDDGAPEELPASAPVTPSHAPPA